MTITLLIVCTRLLARNETSSHREVEKRRRKSHSQQSPANKRRKTFTESPDYERECDSRHDKRGGGDDEVSRYREERRRSHHHHHPSSSSRHAASSSHIRDPSLSYDQYVAERMAILTKSKRRSQSISSQARHRLESTPVSSRVTSLDTPLNIRLPTIKCDRVTSRDTPPSIRLATIKCDRDATSNGGPSDLGVTPLTSDTNHADPIGGPHCSASITNPSPQTTHPPHQRRTSAQEHYRKRIDEMFKSVSG